MPELTYFNKYACTLSGTCTIGATSLSVSAAAPLASGFKIMVGLEIMLVTAGGTTTTWTVTRAQESTTAVEHATGSVVRFILTAGAIDQLRTDMSGYGTYANLPSAANHKSGDRYQCSDSPLNFIHNGSLWVPHYLGRKVKLPVSGELTKVDTPANTSTSFAKGVLEFTTASGTGIVRFVHGTTLNTTYDLTVGMSMMGVNLSGVALFDSANQWQAKIAKGHNSTMLGTLAERRTTTGGFSANLFTTVTSHPIAPLVFWKAISDGTDVTIMVSFDGVFFARVGSFNRTTTFTPDRGGIWFELAATYSTAVCFHFELVQ